MLDIFNNYELQREELLARIAHELELDQTRRDRMEQAYNKVLEVLKKDEIFFKDLELELYVQGSVRIHTTVKPINREEALEILRDLNGQTHQLISSVCISQNGSMIWNYTDKASLTMKQMREDELISYLAKISDEALYAYNVYQIEGEGRSLFLKIEGDEDTIMGLPIKKIQEHLNNSK